MHGIPHFPLPAVALVAYPLLFLVFASSTHTAAILVSKADPYDYVPRQYSRDWRMTAYELAGDWNWRLIMQLRWVGCVCVCV